MKRLVKAISTSLLSCFSSARMIRITPQIVIILCLFQGCCCKNKSNSPILDFAVSENLQIESPDTIHICYTEPINDYTVTINVTPEEPGDSGPAVITFTKDEITFSVCIDDVITDAYELNNLVKDSNDIVLEYVPKPKDSMLYSKELFFFSDIDFDGVEELIILDYGQGTHGVHAYRVFEQDGTQRTDPPYDKLDDYSILKHK